MIVVVRIADVETSGVQKLICHMVTVSRMLPKSISRRGSIFDVSRPAISIAAMVPKPRGAMRRPASVTERPPRFWRNGGRRAALESSTRPIVNIMDDAADEIAVLEQSRRDERLFRCHHVDDEEIAAERRNHRFDDDFRRTEPILAFAAVEHELHGAEAEAQKDEAQPVEFDALVPRMLLEEEHEAKDGEDAERKIDVEAPAPIIEIGEKTAERRAQDRPDHHAHTPHGHGGAALMRRIKVEHRRL